MAEPGRRTSFGAVTLIGLASAATAAVATGRDWVTAAAEIGPDIGVPGSEVSPPALSLALVALACWGVLLVVHRRARRVVAVLGGLAAAGTLAAVVAGHEKAAAVSIHGAIAAGELTGWYYAAAAAALITAAGFVLAWLKCPGWPELGSRYDAPGAGSAAEPQSDLELWRALDEGRDPTV